MKRFLIFIFFILTLPLFLLLISANTSKAQSAAPLLTDLQLLDQSEARAAKYFYDRSLTNGFVKNGEFSLDSSIAATGFGLASLAVISERSGTSAEWTITRGEARARANLILDNALIYQSQQVTNPALYGKAGFLYHFVTDGGQRSGASEVSTVDMALFAAGALTAGQYFGSEVKQKADLVFDNINWNYFLDSQNKLFYLGWKPDQSTNFNIPAPDGGYFSSKLVNGLDQPAQWDQPTDEVILINLLALSSDPKNIDFKKSLYSWPRVSRSYADYNVVNSYFGSLFTYIYGQIFFDFKAMGNDNPPQDALGSPMKPVNWFENAENAARANRQFVIDQSLNFPTFYPAYGPNQWGLSASYRPNGSYFGENGAKPATVNNGVPIHDGTIPPYASISTMPILRTSSSEQLMDNLAFLALKNFYENHYSGLWGNYGPHDSLKTRPDNVTDYSNMYSGISKGPEALMIENYRTGLVNRYFMGNSKICQAVRLQFPAMNGDNDCDTVLDSSDNCPTVANSDQANLNREPIDLGSAFVFDDATNAIGDNVGDACDSDMDHDLLTNVQEATLGLDERNYDFDLDNYLDGAEVRCGSDPKVKESTPRKPAGTTLVDADGDLVPDSCESAFGTDPAKGDTDGDGVLDGWEALRHGSNPTRTDTDGDSCGDDIEMASVDPNRVVGSSDLGAVASKNGAVRGSANYIRTFDMDGNGVINSADLGFVASKFGKSCTVSS